MGRVFSRRSDPAKTRGVADPRAQDLNPEILLLICENLRHLRIPIPSWKSKITDGVIKTATFLHKRGEDVFYDENRNRPSARSANLPISKDLFSCLSPNCIAHPHFDLQKASSAHLLLYRIFQNLLNLANILSILFSCPLRFRSSSYPDY